MMRAVSRLIPLIVLVLWAYPAWAAEAALPPAAGLMGKPIAHPNLNGSLRDVLRQIETLTGSKLSVDWPALEAAGVDGDTKVLLRSSQATGGQLLSLVLMQVARPARPLAWYVEEGVICVTTQAYALGRNRRPTAAGPIAAPGQAASALAKPVPRKGVDLTFSEVPLREVINYFRTISGLNFHVQWHALQQVNVTGETPITLEVRGVSLGKGLDLVLGQVGVAGDKFQRVYWVVDRGVITISTGTALDTQMRTRVQDVTDLIYNWPVRTLADLNVGVSTSSGVSTTGANQGVTGSSAGGGGISTGVATAGAGASVGTATGQERTTETSTGTAETSGYHGDQLIEIIKGAIGPEMWYPQGRGSIYIYNGRLVITQSLLGFKLLEEAGCQ